MPGAWGRFHGLPVRADSAEMFQSMGVRLLRFGGSYINWDGLGWKRWRGPPWLRPTAIADEYEGGSWFHGYLSGWGLFEMADLCTAMGATCVITLNIKDTYPDSPTSKRTSTNASTSGSTNANTSTSTSTGTEVEEGGEQQEQEQEEGVAEYLAELVEYMYGDASSTWGKQRIADGHPNTYNVTHFELGNEGYNPGFAEQVAAMEARAKKVRERARGEWEWEWEWE